MQDPFKGQERLFEEERKVREVISAKIPEYMMEYVRDHPAFRKEAFPEYLMDYHKNHPAFQGAEYLNGKVEYHIA